MLSDEWFQLSEDDINISVERLTWDQTVVLKLKFEPDCTLKFLQIKPCATNCPKFIYFYFGQTPVSPLQGVRLRKGIQNAMQEDIFRTISAGNKSVVFDICDPMDFS